MLAGPHKPEQNLYRRVADLSARETVETFTPVPAPRP